MKSNKQPEIRFPGFHEEWEQRKLMDIGTINTGNTPPTNDNNNYSENGMLWVTPTDITSLVIKNTAKKLSATGERKARIAPTGTILVTCIASIGKNTMILNNSGFNQQINSLTPNEFNDSYFLLTQSEFWSRKMKNIAASGTMQIVNKSEFSNLSFLYPKMEEQQKIGVFFKQLDDTIALHQQELTALKETKQGFLQKMFPKEGEKVPEIRFPGFTDDWEQRKLKDMTDNIGTGKSSYISSDKTEDVKYPILGSTSIIGYASSYDYEGNFVLTARVGANAGSLYQHSGQVKITDNTVFIQGKSLSFLFNLLNHYDLKKLSFGTGQPLVKASELKKLKLSYPGFEEQQKIGAFFKQLDDTIALHQRELDLLKETKKAFLQKMFV